MLKSVMASTAPILESDQMYIENVSPVLLSPEPEAKQGSDFLPGLNSMKLWLLILGIPVALAIAGCSRQESETVQFMTEAPPVSWVADGKTWLYQESMSTADEELLTKFFHLHPGFQGSSDFEGPPKLMTSGKLDRRFYWIRGAKETWTWSCIHFEGGKFRTSEGTGNPFSE